MSGAAFLGIVTLMAVAVFLNGLRFARMSEERIARGRGIQIELPGWLARGRSPAAQVHLAGRIQMIVSPLFLILVTALCFGLLGPVDGIAPITF